METQSNGDKDVIIKPELVSQSQSVTVSVRAETASGAFKDLVMNLEFISPNEE